MILEIDIGNTWAKWRVLDSQHIAIKKGKMPSTEFPHRDVLALKDIHRVRLASVSSRENTMRVSQVLSTALGAASQNLVVDIAETTTCQAGLTNSYEDPARMGVDRWLAMLAAYHHPLTRTAKCGCLVVSCGTAVTVDIIHNDGVHEGGYILPGLIMMRDALLSKTGRIQFIPGEFTFSRVLGNSTATAVEHGAVHAVLSAIEQSCNDYVRRSGSCNVFITGGDALELIKQLRLDSASVSCHYVEELVLDGLRYALP